MQEDTRFKRLSEFISQVFNISKDGSKFPIMTYDHKVIDPTIVEIEEGCNTGESANCSKCQSFVASDQVKPPNCGEKEHNQRDSVVGYDVSGSGPASGPGVKHEPKSKFCGNCKTCESGKLWLCRYKVDNGSVMHQKALNSGDSAKYLKFGIMKSSRKTNSVATQVDFPLKQKRRRQETMKVESMMSSSSSKFNCCVNCTNWSIGKLWLCRDKLYDKKLRYYKVKKMKVIKIKGENVTCRRCGSMEDLNEFLKPHDCDMPHASKTSRPKAKRPAFTKKTRDKLNRNGKCGICSGCKSKFCGNCEICTSGRLWLCRSKVCEKKRKSDKKVEKDRKSDKIVEKDRNSDRKVEKDRNSDKKVEKDMSTDQKVVDGSVSCKKCGCIKLSKELMKLHDCERENTEVKNTSELVRSTAADCDKEAPGQGQSGDQQLCSEKNLISSSVCMMDTVRVGKIKKRRYGKGHKDKGIDITSRHATQASISCHICGFSPKVSTRAVMYRHYSTKHFYRELLQAYGHLTTCIKCNLDLVHCSDNTKVEHFGQKHLAVEQYLPSSARILRKSAKSEDVRDEYEDAWAMFPDIPDEFNPFGETRDPHVPRPSSVCVDGFEIQWVYDENNADNTI